MKGEVLAAAALLPYAGFLLGGLVAIVLCMSTTNVVTISAEKCKWRGGGEREREIERERDTGIEREGGERGRERGGRKVEGERERQR